MGLVLKHRVGDAGKTSCLRWLDFTCMGCYVLLEYGHGLQVVRAGKGRQMECTAMGAVAALSAGLYHNLCDMGTAGAPFYLEFCCERSDCAACGYHQLLHLFADPASQERHRGMVRDSDGIGDDARDTPDWSENLRGMAAD